MSMTTQLRCVAMFFRNDKPNGIGLMEFDTETPTLAKGLSDTQTLCDRAWATIKDKAAESQYYLDQLVAFGKMTDDAKHGMWPVIYGDLYLLTKHGYLKDDEYNGIVYQYVPASFTATVPDDSKAD